MNIRQKIDPIRSIGWSGGKFKHGPTNSIMDVDGVKVGHCTIISGSGKLVQGKGPIRTGVTVILPHMGNLYQKKVRAAYFIANGYGKTLGLMQIKELGTIETPIAITNTLNVGLVYDAIIEYCLQEFQNKHNPILSISPLVTECNDGYLNDIQGRHVKQQHVFEAIENAKTSEKVEEGTFGAATGFITFNLKSGVGTSSRIFPKSKTGTEKDYFIGAIVFPNFGAFEDFNFYGYPMYTHLKREKYFPKSSNIKNKKDYGSIIVILATDLPLTHRQLHRIAKRGAVGVISTGSRVDHMSGECIIAFSTENLVEYNPKTPIKTARMLDDQSHLFISALRATSEVVQEAIYRGILTAHDMEGVNNRIIEALDPADLPEPYRSKT